MRERVCCLLVLNLVSSTLPFIRRPRPRLDRTLSMYSHVAYTHAQNESEREPQTSSAWPGESTSIVSGTSEPAGAGATLSKFSARCTFESGLRSLTTNRCEGKNKGAPVRECNRDARGDAGAGEGRMLAGGRCLACEIPVADNPYGRSLGFRV